VLWFQRKKSPAVERPWIKLSIDDGCPLEVRGESFYQPTIRALVNASEDREIDDDRLTASLVVSIRREPQNPHDVNAVVVCSIDGKTLGHLPRELAGGYSSALAIAEQRVQVCCDARAYGRLHGREWMIGIWLAVPDADQLADILADVAKAEIHIWHQVPPWLNGRSAILDKTAGRTVGR
jgi:hypothetical protein